MPTDLRPCGCLGGNENCTFCYGTGYIERFPPQTKSFRTQKASNIPAKPVSQFRRPAPVQESAKAGRNVAPLTLTKTKRNKKPKKKAANLNIPRPSDAMRTAAKPTKDSLQPVQRSNGHSNRRTAAPNTGSPTKNRLSPKLGPRVFVVPPNAAKSKHWQELSRELLRCPRCGRYQLASELKEHLRDAHNVKEA
jgi:hypothetical protein